MFEIISANFIKFLIVIVINLILFHFNFKIGKHLEILDLPDGKRKLHKEPIPLTGGVFLFVNLFIYYVFAIFEYDFSSSNIFKNIFELNIFFFCSCIIFLLGFLDDKFQISANIKLITLILIFSFLLLIDNSTLINDIRISFLNFQFNIGHFSFFWTLICFLLFINAINMFDGFNLQSGIYFLIFIIFLLYKGLNNYLFIILIIFNLFFIFQNNRNKCFLGDSGTYLISFILGYMSIKFYNNQDIVFADEIVLVMLIPGLDLMRLFFFRILQKRHPFSPDRQHLHHYVLNHLGEKKTLFVLMSCIFITVLISQIFDAYIEMIFLQIFLYLSLILKYRKKGMS